MTTLEPVSVTRLYRMISAQIAAKIRAGEFALGSRLPSERELAATLQVSRTTVREALIALELEGYVEVRVGAGVFVTRRLDKAEESGRVSLAADMTPFELIAVHLMLEPESAALAAKYHTAEQLQVIRDAGRGMGRSGSPTAQNIDFHLAIAEAGGNAALLAAIRHLWGLRDNNPIYNKLEGHFVAEKIWQLAESEHDDVVQAIALGDHAAARRAMRAHFLAIRRRLRNDFKENTLFKPDPEHPIKRGRH